MRTTHRTNKMIALLATALVAGLFFVLYDDFNHLSGVQRERVVEKQIFFDQMVAMKSDPLRRLVLDYSFWDDMVKFVARPDPRWAQGNIDSNFASYQHDALWIFRPNGELVYSVNRAGKGLEHRAPFPLPTGNMGLLFAAKEKFTHFFVATGQGVMEVFGAGIYSPGNVERRGEPAGFFLSGMLWGRAHIGELSYLTRGVVMLQSPEQAGADGEWDPRSGEISFTRALAGIDGKPVKTLVVRMETPDIQQLAREMGNNALIGTALVAVLAVLVVFVLVSRQRLRNANSNLDAAQRTAQLGSWQREVERGICSWSDNLYRVLGLPIKGTVPGLETFYSLVHPEDLSRVRETIERSVREKSGYEIEFRLVRPDGAVRTMRSKGEACLVEGGNTCVVGSTQDITEQSLMESKLSTLIRQKDAFIVRLGHDLKSPLTPLMALLPLVRERCADAEAARMLDICRTSASHIERITAKTLKLVRFSSPLASADLERVPLAAVVDGAINRYAGLMARESIVCKNEISPAIGVHAVSTQIEELFANLISNAVHFSPKGSVIRITAGEDAQGVMASVRDEGAGLEPDQLENIFEEFYKEDEARHELGRPGLGLTICRQIVFNHGGSIWAESPGRGKGTTIRIRLPHAENVMNIVPEGASTCLTSRSCSSMTKN